MLHATVTRAIKSVISCAHQSFRMIFWLLLLFQFMMPRTSRRGAGRHACGRACGWAICSHSCGCASVTASSVGASTSGPISPVHSSSSSGRSLSSASVASSSRASGHPVVVGDLLVTDLLHLIRDEVRQLSLALGSPPLMPSVTLSTTFASITGSSYQGPSAPSELVVNVLWCLRCLSLSHGLQLKCTGWV